MIELRIFSIRTKFWEDIFEIFPQLKYKIGCVWILQIHFKSQIALNCTHDWLSPILQIPCTRTTVSQDVQTWFPEQLAFAKFLSKIKGNFQYRASIMDTALPQKISFILDRNLAKANCSGNQVCTSCDTVVLALALCFCCVPSRDVLPPDSPQETDDSAKTAAPGGGVCAAQEDPPHQPPGKFRWVSSIKSFRKWHLKDRPKF